MAEVINLDSARIARRQSQPMTNPFLTVGDVLGALATQPTDAAFSDAIRDLPDDEWLAAMNAYRAKRN